MGSLAVFIKLLVKAVIAWSIISRIRKAINESMFISILLYIWESGRNKRKIKEWFKGL